MQLGMIGLGRMGANLVRRLTAAGHTCVVYDVDPTAVQAMEGKGVRAQSRRRALASCIGDVIVDGGNSYYRDDIERARIVTALFSRFDSRGEADYADRLLSAMRKRFGGHDENPSGRAAR